MIKVSELAIRKQVYVVWLHVSVPMCARWCACVRGVCICVAYGSSETMS